MVDLGVVSNWNMVDLGVVSNASNRSAILDACLHEAGMRAASLEDLWHPYIVLYTGHCIACGAGFFLSIYTPKIFAGVMVASGLSFAFSAIFGWQMWGLDFGSYLWYGVFIKWLIVNIGATVPVLLLRGCKMSAAKIQAIGIGIYVILGANVIWTLGMESYGHIIVYINRVAGVSLTISLIIHCIAMCRNGKSKALGKKFGLFEVEDQFPYGFGTPLSWLVCYTVWNALFIAKITIGGMLQDILFWVLMVAYQRFDGNVLPVEYYFGFARPVQLGTYIAFTEVMGTFVPYFYEATELTDEQPLPINSHAFFLFIAFMNMLWSFVVVIFALQRLFKGVRDFVEPFEEFVQNSSIRTFPYEEGDEEFEDDYDEEEE